MASEYAPAPSTSLRAIGRPAAVAAGRLRDALEDWLEAERDQLPLWVPVGLGLGIAAWFCLPTRAGWIGFVLASGGVAAGAASLAAGGRAARAVAIFALAAAIGCALIWWRAERVAAPVLARTTVARFDATVERVEPLPAREAMRATLAPDPASALPPRVRGHLRERRRPRRARRGRADQAARAAAPPARRGGARRLRLRAGRVVPGAGRDRQGVRGARRSSRPPRGAASRHGSPTCARASPRTSRRGCPARRAASPRRS